MALSLPGQIAAAAGQPSSVRIGQISSTTPLVLTIQGASFSGESVGILGSYVPALGETVAVLGQSKTQGSDPSSWLILGSSNALTDTGPVPQVKAYQSVTQSLADATNTPITFTNNLWDTGGMHSTTTNTSRFFATRDGRYDVVANLGWGINSTGRRSAALRRSGGTFFAETAVQAVSGSFTFQVVAGDIDLVVGDYVELYGAQFSGVALSTFANDQRYTWLSMRWRNASVG